MGATEGFIGNSSMRAIVRAQDDSMIARGTKMQKLTIDEAAERLGMSKKSICSLFLDADANPNAERSSSAGRSARSDADFLARQTRVARRKARSGTSTLTSKERDRALERSTSRASKLREV
jgi:hypothetical protein